MKRLYNRLKEIDDVTFATGQKIEMVVQEVFASMRREGGITATAILENVPQLKKFYEDESKRIKSRLAISNIDNRLSMDEERLQNFRRDLDQQGTRVRIICKPQGVKHEQNGLSNREIKPLSNKYFLASNIDIISGSRLIITNPFFDHVGIVLDDEFVYELITKLFFDLWNGSEYVVGLAPGDTLSTEKWIEIMNSGGNYGIESVINPVFYPAIFSKLGTNPKSTLVDFGCGLNTMGIQLLYGLPSHIEGLKHVHGIEKIRQTIDEFIGFDTNETFVEESIRYASEMDARELKIIWKELISNNELPLEDESVDLCLSRNFIVHLNYDDFEYHLSEMYRVLQVDGYCIIATLNPAYEQKKYQHLTGGSLADGERYSHYHGEKGELGTWIQYFKERERLESLFAGLFIIESVDSCMPIDDKKRESNPLYYDEECPMALVYTLRKK